MNRDLLTIARNSIREHMGLPIEHIVIPDKLNLKRATFVTLTIGDNLRGCIGTLEPVRSIAEDIKHNAVSAAFYDPRFPPLSPDELKTITIEISILSPLKEILFTTENDILQQIIPFKMGLLLEYGLHRGTFLPQVWDHFPEPMDFFRHLKVKAGLGEDFFNSDIKLYYYEVVKCRD